MDLLSVQGYGALYTAVIFLAVLIGVHIVKLALIGYRTRGKKLPPEQPKPKEPAPEPVYYIVEKKKKRPKAEYSAPKRITFKDQSS